MWLVTVLFWVLAWLCAPNLRSATLEVASACHDHMHVCIRQDRKLQPPCAGEYDAVAESAAMPSLLQEFVEAAYLLPRFASFVKSFLSEEKPGDVSPQCANYMDAACLSFFHDAMLPPHPMHINLTSCACLLRFLADEIPDPEEPSQPYCGWDSYEGTIDDVCGCLHAGLQVTCHQSIAIPAYSMVLKKSCQTCTTARKRRCKTRCCIWNCCHADGCSNHCLFLPGMRCESNSCHAFARNAHELDPCCLKSNTALSCKLG